VLLFGRFAPGMGTALPTLVGASGLSRRRFIAFDVLGAVLWSATFVAIGCGVKVLFDYLKDHRALAIVAASLVALTLGGVLANVRKQRAKSPGARAASPEGAERALILTADDFGLALPVNEAIELAHQNGALTTTSLMVGQPATDDAAARAQRNPALRVGLHLTLCEGLPTLPARAIPLLTSKHGELYAPAWALFWFTLRWPSRAFREQLLAEIRAQFQAFKATGLELDHVNAHNNLQLHPAVLPLLMLVARENGVSAVRIPYEPLLSSWRAGRSHFVARAFVWLTMGSWSRLLRGILRQAGFVVNDYIFGVFDCGGLNERLMTRLIEALPVGSTEIHCHPATRTCQELEGNAPGYQHAQELDALLSPKIREAIGRHGVVALSGYAQLARAADSR
jgi:hopanoid biosynthesis associated protein HpnK